MLHPKEELLVLAARAAGSSEPSKMEFEPAEYQRLEIRQFPPRSLRETVEGRYWRRFKAPVIAKQA